MFLSIPWNICSVCSMHRVGHLPNSVVLSCLLWHRPFKYRWRSAIRTSPLLCTYIKPEEEGRCKKDKIKFVQHNRSSGWNNFKSYIAGYCDVNLGLEVSKSLAVSPKAHLLGGLSALRLSYNYSWHMLFEFAILLVESQYVILRQRLVVSIIQWVPDIVIWIV